MLRADSLDDLTKLATTLFSPVPNRGRDALPMINEHPFGADEKCVSCAPNLDNSEKLMLLSCF